MTVLDASVAVKLFRPERDSEIADQVYQEQLGKLIAPAIFAVEVAAALVREANAIKQSRTDLEMALTAFFSMLSDRSIVVLDTDVLALSRASRLALDLGHPLKDCLYLELAISRNRPLLTADAKFAAKARTLGHTVQLLGEHRFQGM